MIFKMDMGCLCQRPEQLILETQLPFKQGTVALFLPGACEFINPTPFSSDPRTAHRSGQGLGVADRNYFIKQQINITCHTPG